LLSSMSLQKNIARTWGFKRKNPDDFVGNASEGANGDVGAPERFTAGQASFQACWAFLPIQTGRLAARARLA
jgi:hypothetical protein